jgi:hypothetical protein
MGWNICEILLHALKMIKQKFQETSTFGMTKHGLRVLENYSWKQKFKIVCNKKYWFSFRFCNTKFLFVFASDLICWSKCGLVGKSQNIHNRLSTPSSPRWSTQPLHHKKTSKWQDLNPCQLDSCLDLLLSFYNNKSCSHMLRWNCRNESWWSWYHCFPSLGRVVLCWEKNNVFSQQK